MRLIFLITILATTLAGCDRGLEVRVVNQDTKPVDVFVDNAETDEFFDFGLIPVGESRVFLIPDDEVSTLHVRARVPGDSHFQEAFVLHPASDAHSYEIQIVITSQGIGLQTQQK